MEVAVSVNGVPIRLTDERWTHIVGFHDDMAGYYDDCLAAVESPDLVLSGNQGTLKAIRAYGKKGYLNVVYREISLGDGFIVSAFFSHKINRRAIIWRR